MRKVLIAGASAGLGLAFVKKYLEESATVFAGMRNTDNEEIKALKNQYGDQLIPFTLDVSDTQSVERGFDSIADYAEALDVVIYNAGINSKEIHSPLEEMDIDKILPVLNTNAVGSLRVAKRAVPLLRKGEDRMYVDISSAGGSLKHIIYCDNAPEYPYAYCMSKSALNMSAAILQRYVRPDGIKVLCFHPGGLKSRMLDLKLQPYYAEGRISCEESAGKIMELIKKNRHQMDAPMFWSYDGTVMPF